MNIRCPKCGAEYELDDALLGRKVECSVCNQKFIIGGHERVPQTTAPLKMSKAFEVYFRFVYWSRCRHCACKFSDVRRCRL